MLEELDFEKEARNTEEFRRFLAESKMLNQATAPKVYREYTTKKVFTMDPNSIISIIRDPLRISVVFDSLFCKIFLCGYLF
mgnify:CR=1 FL=1